MRLAIDIGNTSISYAFFKKNRLISRHNLATANYKKFQVKKTTITEIIYASVVPRIDSFFKKYFAKNNFKKLTAHSLPNFKIKLKNKKEAGIDRLVNAYGVSALYTNKAIIIDFGSATTLCILKNNTYLGGLICPGINMTRHVLHEKTAKLPLIELKIRPRKIIGKNTLEAMQSGLFYGYQAMIEGLIIRLKKELGSNFKIIATGGYAKLICKTLKQKVNIIDPDLTLKSLNIIGNKLTN